MLSRLAIVASALLFVVPATSAQTVRTGVLDGIRRAQLAELGDAAYELVIDAMPGRGVVRALSGPVALQGGDAIERSADLVTRFGLLFDVTADVHLSAPRVQSERSDGSARRVHVAQMVQGFALEGHGVWLRFGADGRLIGAQGVVSHAGQSLTAAQIDPELAEQIALSHLAALGHDPDAVLSGPRARPVARLLAQGVALIWDVDVVSHSPLHPRTVAVDAHTGAVLGVRDAFQSAAGEGTYSFEDTDTTFATRNGKGSYYKNVKRALKSKFGNGKLRELSSETVIPSGGDGFVVSAEAGDLFGRFAHVFDDLSFSVLSESFNFSLSTDDGDPLTEDWDSDLSLATHQLFDHVNTYHWITQSALYHDKVFDGIATDYAIPVVVNAEGVFNAFYSPTAVIPGFPDGFWAFGDFDATTCDTMDDFSRDPTIVTHEYNHGVLNKAGVAWGDEPLDTPARMVNEAVADYFSGSFHRDWCTGPVLALFSGDDLAIEGECVRDLSAARIFPDNVFDVLGAETMLPEEHEAGLILGSTLAEIHRAVKQKVADASIAASIDSWPASNAAAGFPVVDEDNVQDAMEAFFSMAMTSLLDEIGTTFGAKRLGRALGAAMMNGVVGSATTAYTIDAGEGAKLKLKSEFRGSIAAHAIDVVLAEGQSVNLSIKGKQGTLVDVALGATPGDGTPGLVFTQEKKTNAKGTSASFAKIEVTIAGTYRISFSNPGAEGGAYSANIRVK